MNSKPIKIPGPDHPITITPARERITVTVAGRRIADTREALILKEAGYPPVHYIQHSAHIEPGREGLFNLIRSLPPTLKYQPGVIAASGDYVVVHSRFSGTGRPRAWIAADVCRIADGVLAEHWQGCTLSVGDELRRCEYSVLPNTDSMHLNVVTRDAEPATITGSHKARSQGDLRGDKEEENARSIDRADLRCCAC